MNSVRRLVVVGIVLEVITYDLRLSPSADVGGTVSANVNSAATPEYYLEGGSFICKLTVPAKTLVAKHNNTATAINPHTFLTVLFIAYLSALAS